PRRAVEEPLRRGGQDRGPAARLEERPARRGRAPGEAAVERERIAGAADRGGELAGQVDLVAVAGAQVVGDGAEAAPVGAVGGIDRRERAEERERSGGGRAGGEELLEGRAGARIAAGDLAAAAVLVVAVDRAVEAEPEIGERGGRGRGRDRTRSRARTRARARGRGRGRPGPGDRGLVPDPPDRHRRRRLALPHRPLRAVLGGELLERAE